MKLLRRLAFSLLLLLVAVTRGQIPPPLAMLQRVAADTPQSSTSTSTRVAKAQDQGRERS